MCSSGVPKVDHFKDCQSTLASEAASLSIALDRQLYLRLLIQSLQRGEPEYTPEWRHQLLIPGILVTDAKSLYDHLKHDWEDPEGAPDHDRSTRGAGLD